VLAVVNGLRLQQISREALERATHIDVDQWFYQMDWVEQPLTSTQPKKNDVGNWLIFANESAVSTHLVEQLKSKGENCYLVLEGNQFEHNDSMQWRINPTAPDQFHQLLNEVTAEAKETLYGVIDLWGIQRPLSDQSDLESIHSSLERANGSLLYLVQALASSKNRMPRLWLVTQGAQAIKNESSVNPLATTLWGFGNVIALEHPALNCARIDLDLSDTDPGNLFDEIWDSTDEDQVAFRNNKRYVARLVHGAGLSKPTESSNIESVNVRADATYLISGGLGGLGFVSAHWLVDKGARHLVLLGRSDPSTDVQRVINEMKSQGVDIYVAPVDVSQKEQLEKLFHHIEGNMPPLCGVIHAAGVVDDGILNEQTWSRFRTVMAPKIDGTWNLHTLTSGLNLDFFILFSAGAALLGSAGQGNYASANAFLDGFAQYRHQCGLPVLSINWGAWADVGMASRLGSQNRRRWTSRGMNLIQPARGIQAMQRLMERHVTQVAVLPIDWNQFGGQQNGKSIQPLLRQMIQGKAAQPQTSTLTLAEIENISASEQEHALQEYIKGQVTQVLGLDPSQSLNMYLPLINLGMDSLMAVELKNKIENDFGINVPIAYFLEEASVNGLAAKLHDTLSHNALEKQKDNNNNETIDGAKAQLLLENIDQMSEDEMDALLNKLLTDKEES
jgi:NAD(P)-dependent dehydrogenase (short-subunit alcohol dehydrogenase family)